MLDKLCEEQKKKEHPVSVNLYMQAEWNYTYVGCFLTVGVTELFYFLPLFARSNNESSCACLLRCCVRSESAVQLIRQHSCYKLHI